MRFDITLALLALQVAPSSAQTASQFDLLCAGQAQDNGVAAAWSAHYSLDLQRGIWCISDQCATPQVIFSVSPNFITLTQVSFQNVYDSIQVSRSSGALDGYVTFQRPNDQVVHREAISASCARAPYTPIPANKF